MIHLKKILVFTGSVVISTLIANQPASAQRVCIVTDTGKVECGRVREDSIPKKSQSLEFEDFTLTLQDCQRLNKNVKCSFFVTMKKDGKLYLRYGKISDFYGSNYDASSIKFGQNLRQNSDGVWGELLRGIPLKATLTFEEIPDPVRKIAALQMSIEYYGNNKRDRAVFRDVNILD
jgi:hypothetical protein